MQGAETNYNTHGPNNVKKIFWKVFPPFAINELLLGQRQPKVSLSEKGITVITWEQYQVPCPHCHTIHSSQTWSHYNRTFFKNWFGLYCPNCGNIIPCIMNYTSLLILTITYPIWGWFRKQLKKNWLGDQPKRFVNLKFRTIKNPYDNGAWIYRGVSYGMWMFL